jgi:hypothetical protein
VCLLYLISNGSGNQVNIAGTQNGLPIMDQLYVGQAILLQSSTQTFPEQRKIQNVKQIPISGDILLELEGDQDLVRYKIDDLSNIRIYKPNTANSSVYILIPSLEPLSNDIKTETPWFLKSSDIVEKRQKIDLNIDDKGDLTLNSNSDLQLTYGLDNSIQAVKLKLSVELGELRRHKDYGLASVVGNRNLDVEQLKSSLTNSIVKSIQSDQRFSGLDRLDVAYVSSMDAKTVTAFSITMVVRLTGSDQLVPINFSVNV